MWGGGVNTDECLVFMPTRSGFGKKQLLKDI